MESRKIQKPKTIKSILYLTKEGRILFGRKSYLILDFFEEHINDKNVEVYKNEFWLELALSNPDYIEIKNFEEELK